MIQSPLFKGIAENDLKELLKCLNAKESAYEKNDFIFRAGDKASSIGVILSGGVYVLKEDFWGNRTILAKLEEGDLFGEAFACREEEKLPVSVMAVEKSRILFVDYRRIITNCPNTCVFHASLIENMIRILAGKNVMLTQKMEHMSKRTTREKILSYLSAQAVRCGSNAFTIPFNRQELADFLCVERSAMSAELGKMRKEGLLSCEKSRFVLKKQ